jgi:hypothetical protein
LTCQNWKNKLGIVALLGILYLGFTATHEQVHWAINDYTGCKSQKLVLKPTAVGVQCLDFYPWAGKYDQVRKNTHIANEFTYYAPIIFLGVIVAYKVIKSI